MLEEPRDPDGSVADREEGSRTEGSRRELASGRQRNGLHDEIRVGLDARDGVVEAVGDPNGAFSGRKVGGRASDRDPPHLLLQVGIDPRDRVVVAVEDPDRTFADGDA